MLLIDRHEYSILPLLPSGSFDRTDLACDEHGRSADAMWLAEGPDPSEPQLVGVERKRLSDALDSQLSGRMIDQLRCNVLCKGCRRIWILIEDEFRPSPYSGVLEKLKASTGKKSGKDSSYWVPALTGNSKRGMWESFYKWLASICQQLTDLGVQTRLWVTRNDKESAAWLYAQYSLDQKPYDEHKSLQAFVDIGRPTQQCSVCRHGQSKHKDGYCSTCRDRCSGQPKRSGSNSSLVRPCHVAQIMATFDLVGWDRALAIGDYFSSPREAANADVKEYLQIEGVGKKTAEGVVKQWNERRVVRP